MFDIILNDLTHDMNCYDLRWYGSMFIHNNARYETHIGTQESDTGLKGYVDVYDGRYGTATIKGHITELINDDDVSIFHVPKYRDYCTKYGFDHVEEWNDEFIVHLNKNMHYDFE